MELSNREDIELKEIIISQQPYTKAECTVKRLLEELNSLPEYRPDWSIFRASNRLGDVNADLTAAYKPKAVSIGPLDHGNTSITALPCMEIYKRRYMKALLDSTGKNNLEQALRCCIDKMTEIESEVHRHYAENVRHDRFNIPSILAVDGCFIIELFLRFSIKMNKHRNDVESSSCNCKFLCQPLRTGLEDDPIFKSEAFVSILRRDLALLENQIPLFALQNLFTTLISLAGCCISDPLNFLTKLAFDFFEPILHSEHQPSLENLSSSKHLLHLLLEFHQPRRDGGKEGGGVSKRKGDIIHNVTKLREIGIKLKRSKADSGLFSFNFNNGVLEIPPLHIHEGSDSLFRNLLEFEYSCHGVGQHITSYILLMDCLIDTTEDVKLLVDKGIIVNELGSPVELVNFFKAICKQGVVKDFYFQDLCGEVKKYYHSRTRRYYHVLKQDYFATPWKTISLIVAALLLGLAVADTLYSALSYYIKP